MIKKIQRDLSCLFKGSKTDYDEALLYLEDMSVVC